MTRAMILGAGLLLAGCGGGTMARPATPSAAPVRPISTAGLDRVMGQNAAGLTREFGNPDADVREGNARKLQFKGPICVLDTYLYPPKGGGEAAVTYVDTRQPDGSPIDRASCVAALARRGGGK
ncbi:MAG: hypothetical protein E7773_02950 [Sphingomonas sp.]|uniref:hypothetical protein n=1 Tax=Sphingomonas sp. TaxID=28214 RepID=UPI0011FD7B1F|nr:hypothetical protein [Sphingomonas sp.]THD37951.1 MAG: hypothetical protein E7773_02950 [Sphingomonas sp.]